MPGLPSDERFDSTLDLLADPYGFIGRRCHRLGTDAFRTRLMLRPAVCMRGAEAGELFYGDGRFSRVGAMPPTTLRLLQDKGSVQQLEGEAHRLRKAMFLAVMTPEAIQGLCRRFEAELLRAVRAAGPGPISLFDLVRPVLCRAAAGFAGVPLDDGETARRTAELTAMVDAAGSVGPAAVRALVLRRRAERWAKRVVAAARDANPAPGGTALAVIAGHRDGDGALLPLEVAAVELLNVLRPTVAIDRFLVFAAHALHLHPELRPRLAEDDGERERFVQEVRRTYPFFPFVGGRARLSFRWRDHAFEKGDWVLFDLYGTNHDPDRWREPEAFDPDRFTRWSGGAYDFVAQGGGRFESGHRCPGEWSTIALMKCAVRLFAGRLAYEVPAQDLSLDTTSAPALPRDRFLVAGLRDTAGGGTETTR